MLCKGKGNKIFPLFVIFDVYAAAPLVLCSLIYYLCTFFNCESLLDPLHYMVVGKAHAGFIYASYLLPELAPIYVCIVMNDIVLVVWNVLLEDRACGNDIVVFFWIGVDVAIEDFNLYVMIMIIMMILIWDDVVNKGS